MYKAHKVLVGVSEAHATANATLEERCRTAHAERDHALILVPDVDHPVELVVATVDHKDVEQLIPIGFQLSKCLVDLLACGETVHEHVGFLLVDDLFAFPFLVLLVLDITQQEDEVTLLARFQIHLDIVAGDGTPSVSDAVARFPLNDGLRCRVLVVESHEALAVCVKALDGCVDVVESIVVAALAVFCLMVDRRSLLLYLHLTGREIALEVLHVSGSVPQAPLLKGEDLEMLDFVAVVLQGQHLHLSCRVQRHEEEHAGHHTELAACDACVVHTMAALIAVERCAARFPSRVPHCVTVLDVEIAAVVVHRHVVVAVACDAAELCVFVERVASGSVGDQREEVLVA